MHYRLFNIFLIIFFLQSSISQKVYSQTKNDKKRVKLLLKLSNPKWLKINNKKAFFKHNISSSPSRVSTTSSDQIGRLNSGQSKTQKFLYNK